MPMSCGNVRLFTLALLQKLGEGLSDRDGIRGQQNTVVIQGSDDGVMHIYAARLRVKVGLERRKSVRGP